MAIIIIDRESGFAPLPVKFDASNSTDQGMDIKEYSWDFDNDGKFDAFGIKANHTFNNPGAYTVRLRVTDSKNNVSDALITIKVDEASLRAIIAAGASACVSSPVSFDASLSIDQDNDITGYEWDFDDDGVIDAAGVSVNYSFPEQKEYNVRLTVRDSKGNNSEAIHYIRVYGISSVDFTADEDKIVYPLMTTLRWHADNITNLSITDNNTNRKVYEGTGSDDYININPYRTTIYTLTASGPCGEVSKTLTVFVYPSHSHAILTASANSGCIPLGVSFDASASSDIKNDISSYEWDFDGDGTYEASGINSSYTYSLSGEYHVGLKITDPLKNTSESTLTIMAYGQPLADIKSETGLIGLNGNTTITWTTTNATSVFIDNGIGPVSANGTITIPQSGTKTYTLSAKGPCGNAADTITIRPDMPISIMLISPQQNEIVIGPEVLVRGSINNPLGGETVVMVNGYPAFLYNGGFVVSGIPLAEDGNTLITIEAFGSYGNKGKATLNLISFARQKLITVSADNNTGISPLEAIITVSGDFDYTPVLTYTTPTGGVVEFIERTEPNQYHIRLTGEGIYTFTATITSSANYKYSDSISIIVEDKLKVDTALKKQWDDMKTSMRIGDVDGALGNFSEFSKDEYRELFTLLKNKLPDIANEMAELELVSIRRNIAKYRLKRDEIIEGRQYSLTYYVYFSQDPFGNWTLDGF